jgi:hypothetical protein
MNDERSTRPREIGARFFLWSPWNGRMRFCGKREQMRSTRSIRFSSPASKEREASGVKRNCTTFVHLSFLQYVGESHALYIG